MNRRDHAPSTKPRPLPPLPLLFSPRAVAGNVRLLREGQGAEWCSNLELGACGLDRAIKKGQVVKLEVEGTGYFSVILRTCSVAASLADPTTRSKEDRIQKSDIVDEVKFKLKKSKFLIEVEKNSRSRLYVLATAVGAGTSKHDVRLPRGLDPWLAFNVVFGNLRVTLLGGHGNHDRPWQFDKSHGMNIVQKSKQEVASLLHNPCATVGTERPLGQGEAMEVSVEPETTNSQSQVKILLTHSLPLALKLYNPCVYFSEDNVLNRLLCDAYTIKRFKGTFTITVETETGSLDVEEVPHDAERLVARATHSINLTKLGLDVHKPLYVCLELLRVSVDIQVKGRPGESGEQNTQPGYALTMPGQAITQVPVNLRLPAEDDYLTPISDVRPPPQPSPQLTVAPRTSPRPSLSSSSSSAASSPGPRSTPISPGSASWTPASTRSTPSPSPRTPGGRIATNLSSADRRRFFPRIQEAVPDYTWLPLAPCLPRTDPPCLFGDGPYVRMDGYVLPSGFHSATRSAAAAKTRAGPSQEAASSNPDPTYLTPIPPPPPAEALTGASSVERRADQSAADTVRRRKEDEVGDRVRLCGRDDGRRVRRAEWTRDAPSDPHVQVTEVHVHEQPRSGQRRSAMTVEPSPVLIMPPTSSAVAGSSFASAAPAQTPNLAVEVEPDGHAEISSLTATATATTTTTTTTPRGQIHAGASSAHLGTPGPHHALDASIISPSPSPSAESHAPRAGGRAYPRLRLAAQTSFGPSQSDTRLQLTPLPFQAPPTSAGMDSQLQIPHRPHPLTSSTAAGRRKRYRKRRENGCHNHSDQGVNEKAGNVGGESSRSRSLSSSPSGIVFANEIIEGSRGNYSFDTGDDKENRCFRTQTRMEKEEEEEEEEEDYDQIVFRHHPRVPLPTKAERESTELKGCFGFRCRRKAAVSNRGRTTRV